MKLASFNKLRRTIHQESGIVIGENKSAMVMARLSKRIKALGLSNEEEYLKFLEKNKEDELVELLDVISTNVTRFYREEQHFTFAAGFLEDLLNKGVQRIRIWCAASSTGEEPYTIAMTVAEAMRLTGRQADVRILATDISPSVLKTAHEGIYRSDKLDGVPLELRKRYFKKHEDGYEAMPALKKLLVFRRLNLMEHPYPLKGPLDLIFCRNVMIYFNAEDRERVVRGFHRLLAPEGRLIVGLSESLNGVQDILKREGASIYRRNS